MNKLNFFVFYKTNDCTIDDCFSVQHIKAGTKSDALEKFTEKLGDKDYIRLTKVANEIEYNSLVKNNVTLSEV